MLELRHLRYFIAVAEELNFSRVLSTSRFRSERSGELAYETIRSERIAALVAATHPLAGKGEVELNAFADDAFVLSRSGTRSPLLRPW